MRTSLKRQKNATAILVDDLILAMIDADCMDYERAYNAWNKYRPFVGCDWKVTLARGMQDARDRLHLFIPNYETVDRILKEIERNGYHRGVFKPKTMSKAKPRRNK